MQYINNIYKYINRKKVHKYINKKLINSKMNAKLAWTAVSGRVPLRIDYLTVTYITHKYNVMVTLVPEHRWTVLYII